MKQIKYILSLILFIIQMLLLNELFILHLYDFTNAMDYTTFYLPVDNSVSEKTMLQDIKQEAIKNHIDTFFIDVTTNGLLSETRTIYCTDGVEDYLKNNCDVFSDTYTSIFSGKVSIIFSDITTISNLDGIETYYLIGDKDNQVNFKKALIGDYAGKYPKEGSKNYNNKLIIIFIWLIITILISLVTYYDVLFKKKEVLVKISFGENVISIILKEFFTHTSILLGIFFICRYIYLRNSSVIFLDRLNIICALISIIGSALLYLLFKFTNIKECFSNVILSKKILKFSYVLKIVSVLLLPFILSSNISEIAKGMEFYKQKEFFNNHKDYYYVSIKCPFVDIEDFSKSQDMTLSLNLNYYKKFYNKFKPEILCVFGDNTEGNTIILINENAKYLLNDIIDINTLTKDYDYYFFIAENNGTSIQQIEDMLKSNIDLRLNVLSPSISNYNGITFKEDTKYNYTYKTISYTKNTEILSITDQNNNLSQYSKNPYVIYMTDKNTDNLLMGLQYCTNIMYKINQDDMQTFIDENNLDNLNWTIDTQNVNEYYLYMLSKFKRIILLNSIVVLLVMIIELIIISTIIKLEYKVNAIELSIKKVLGYNLLQRNKMIFILIGISFSLCMIVSYVISLVTDFIELKYFLVSNVIVLFMELIVVICNINKIEKTNVARILKGENL